MSVFDPKYSKLTIANRSWSPIENITNALGYEDDYILLYFDQFDVNITGPSSLPYTYLKAGKLITVKIKKPVSFIRTNLYFVEDYDGIIPKNSQVITNFNTIKEFYIQSSKNVGTLLFNRNNYDDIYVSTNNRVNFVIYYKKDHVDDEYGGVNYDNIVLQIGSTDLNNNRCPMYCLMQVYAQNIGIGWDNDHMGVNEDSVIAAIINGTYIRADSYPLEPENDTTYKLSGDFSSDTPANKYYKNYRYTINTNTVDASESFEFEYGYAVIDESKINITSYVANTISDISHTAPDGTLYNSVVVTIPKREYVLDLTRNGIVAGSNAISPSGTITPIIPDNYLINKISGGVRISDVTIDINSNGTKEYNSPNGFYNAVTINTNIQSIGDTQIKVGISDIDFDRDLILSDEATITLNITYNTYDNYELYTSIDGTTFNKQTTRFITFPVNIGDTIVTLYYKFKNINNNTYTNVSTVEVPVKEALLYNINTPEIQAEKISGGIIRLYVKNIEWISYGLTCELNVNNINYTINNTHNNGISVNSNSEYMIIEAYFAKNIDNNVYTSNRTNLILDTKTLSVVSTTEIEYRDTAYVYSKVPTKYYGIYLTLLKLLSDNGEQLLQDCVSACKSNSHKLIALWNMFNAACAAYLNDNEKLAELLIKNITSQLNIMYDENYDFIQHRVFIGNYTLNNKNNPNEFETVELYKLTPSEHDICSELELKFTINQTSDIHYIMLPPELDLKYVSFGDTIKTVLFDAENNINLYKERSWRMADKDTDGTIYWYYSSAGAFNDIITIICKYK